MKKGVFLKFLSELKRRNVYKSALAYIVAGWIILQVQAVTLPSFHMPLSIIKWTVIFLALAFPFWLVFSWVYELTPEGIKKTVDVDPSESITPHTGNRFNKIIIGALGIAICLLLFNAFRNPSEGSVDPQESPQLLNMGQDNSGEQELKGSIAVLAFADMSPQKDQEYFSDGISEEILNLLARIPDLRVISRTSSFSFKGKDATVAEIGEALNVSHVLEGSIRKSGNTLRIKAQLIQVSDGAYLWSETYDREMEDIFGIQDEIATRVTRELEATLVDGRQRSRIVDPEAYEHFLRARFEDRTAEGMARSIELLEMSITLDPTYAPAWAYLANYKYYAGISLDLIPFADAVSQATASINEAIRLDPNYAFAYRILATIEQGNWEFEKAALIAEKAVLMDSGNPSGKTKGLVMNFASPDKISAAFQEALVSDPLNYDNYYSLGQYLFFADRLEEAEKAFRILEEQYPNRAILHYSLMKILLAQGKKEEALAEAEKEQDTFWRLYAKCFAVYALGKTQEADALLEEMIRELTGQDGAVNIAEVYAFRGETEKAFDWLEKGLEEKSPTLPEGIYYPAFKLLHDDPRWRDLIQRMGLPEGHEIPMGDAVIP